MRQVDTGGNAIIRGSLKQDNFRKTLAPFYYSHGGQEHTYSIGNPSKKGCVFLSVKGGRSIFTIFRCFPEFLAETILW